MILDKLENIGKYSQLKEIKNVLPLEFLKGKELIKGNDFWKIGLEYDTKESTQCLWEAHKKYIDIHVILEGEEKVQISDLKNMIITKEYDLENDYYLFDGAPEQELVLKKGMFLCLYPNEVHKTSVINNKSSRVLKHVFKILITK